MKNIYTHYDQLPLVLNADQLASFLNISRANAYTLLHRCDFPTIRIGTRMMVQKDKMLAWLDKQIKVDFL